MTRRASDTEPKVNARLRRQCVLVAYEMLPYEDARRIDDAANAIVSEVKEHNPRMQMNIDMAMELLAGVGQWMVDSDARS